MVALLVGALAAPPAPRLASTVTVDRPTQGPVVSVAGNVVVQAPVEGDVIALAGSVFLAAGARVDGDVVALGGRVEGPGTASGRVVGIASLGWPVAPLSARGGWRVWAGLVALRLGLWLVAASLFLFLMPRIVRAAGERLRGEALRTAGVGVFAVVAWLALVTLAVATAASSGGALVLVGGVLLLLVVKAMGVVAVAWWLGGTLAPALPVRLRGEMPRTALALAALVAVSLLPYAGAAVWVAANLAGIGGVVAGVLARVAAPRLVPRLAL